MAADTEKRPTEKDIPNRIRDYLNILLTDNALDYTETLHESIIAMFMNIAEEKYRRQLGKLK